MASIIRLYVDQPLSKESDVQLSESQIHYLYAVMRIKEGTLLHLFNEKDGEWSFEITNLQKKKCNLRAHAQLREKDHCPDITLVFAPIKKQRLDFIIEKACELGVRTLQPIITKRCVVSKLKSDRLHAQVIEAAEQCERLNIPFVKEEIDFVKFFTEYTENKTFILLDETGGAKPLIEILQNFKEADPKVSQSYAIIVGPEGGFDPSELDLLEKLSNVTAASIGPRILRAETAALSALTAWQLILGDLNTPLRSRN